MTDDAPDLTYGVGEVSTVLGVTPATIRNYTRLFREWLSDLAAPEAEGTRRQFTYDDVVTLWAIREKLATGEFTYDDVLEQIREDGIEKLRQQASPPPVHRLEEPEEQPAEESTAMITVDEMRAWITPLERAIVTLERAAERSERAAEHWESIARQQEREIERLREELEEQRQAPEPERRRSWWDRLLGR